MPVPMHIDTTPYRWPVRRIWWSSVATCSEWSSVATCRAPVQPSGWPSAMAPPSGLTWLGLGSGSGSGSEVGLALGLGLEPPRRADLMHGDTQLAHTIDGLRGEGFVDLEDVDLRETEIRTGLGGQSTPVIHSATRGLFTLPHPYP
eukprot:scaffold92276_cov63-Phaeocystis_antarctica.AAC.2